MKLSPSVQRYGLVIAIFTAGMAFAWLLLTESNSYLRWTAFLVCALVISLLIQEHRRRDALHRAEREARLIVGADHAE